MNITLDMEKMKSKIKSWLLKVTADGSWEKYNDLHIDEVDKAFKSKANWIVGGLECYTQAISIIQELNMPYTIELAFSLKSKKKVSDYIITDIGSLKKEFDYSPPSLYVFHNEWEGLKDLKQKGIKLRDFADNVTITGSFYYYQVFNERDNEVRRVLYCI